MCGVMACSWDPDFKIAAAHVISPPLRSKDHQLALRRALAGGHLHLVGTDHCGWNSTQKAVGRHDFRCCSADQHCIVCHASIACQTSLLLASLLLA